LLVLAGREKKGRENEIALWIIYKFNVIMGHFRQHEDKKTRKDQKR
jgi:hypothetical protein